MGQRTPSGKHHMQEGGPLRLRTQPRGCPLGSGAGTRSHGSFTYWQRWHTNQGYFWVKTTSVLHLPSESARAEPQRASRPPRDPCIAAPAQTRLLSTHLCADAAETSVGICRKARFTWSARSFGEGDRCVDRCEITVGKEREVYAVEPSCPMHRRHSRLLTPGQFCGVLRGSRSRLRVTGIGELPLLGNLNRAALPICVSVFSKIEVIIIIVLVSCRGINEILGRMRSAWSRVRSPSTFEERGYTERLAFALPRSSTVPGT